MSRRGGHIAFCLLVLSLAGCSSLAYKSRITEFHNAEVPPSRFATIAVLPLDPKGFDPGIAARVRESLKKEGVNIATPRVMVPESEVSMAQLCPKNDPASYQGVLWVTFDRVILRDCESTAVAYRAIGGYSGVDALAKKLLVYLRSGAAATTTTN
ncbi:MAG TPA: hypothetical protein VGC44_00310 [Longimicrobiales bacterium]